MSDTNTTTPRSECALSEKALPHYLATHIARTADEHWLWLGRLSPWGGAVIEIEGQELSVTRVCYEIVFAQIPRTAWLGSDCDEATCVNPLHHSLRVGAKLGNKRPEMAIEYSRCIEQAILWATERKRPWQERVTSFELAKAYREGLEACTEGDD